MKLDETLQGINISSVGSTSAFSLYTEEDCGDIRFLTLNENVNGPLSQALHTAAQHKER